MKHREQLLALLGLALLAVAWPLVHFAHGPSRNTVVADVCHTPLRILEPQGPRPIGSAVIFHGLSASRGLMQTAGQWLAASGLRVYLVDSPGHGDSTEPFSFSRAEECAGDLVESLSRRGEIRLDRTVLLGHSMGGAIAIRLADRFPTAATIAVSPAPLVRSPRLLPEMLPYTLPRRMPVNLLVFVGGWEPAIAAEADEALMRAAGGERLQPEDFLQRRAAKLVVIPRATHTSLLFDRRVRDWSLGWARSALNEPSAVSVFRGSPVAGALLGLAGLVLLFSATVGGLTSLLGARAAEQVDTMPNSGKVVALWAVASLLAVSLLKYWVPLKGMRLLTGDYLASLFLLSGAVLLLLFWKEARAATHPDLGAVAMACALGLATVLVFGAWLNWQMTDAWMNSARWWRFVAVTLVCLPYFVAEELALGPPGKRRGRFAMFLALRLELWLALLLALYVLGSRQILVVLLAIYLLLVCLAQRSASDAVRRRTGSLAAAAVIGAILTAWFVAAVFPLA